MFKKEEIDYIDAAKRRLYLAWESLDKKNKSKIINENLIKEFKEGWTDNAYNSKG